MVPRMLIMARESRGMTQKDLALAIGMPPGSLSKVENGSAELSEDRMEQIVAALRYPRHVFEWSDPIYGFGSSSFYHRKQLTIQQTMLRTIQAKVNFLAMRMRRMARSIDVKAPFSIPRYDDGDYTSVSDVAQAVRAMWMVPLGPVDDVIRLLESAGAYVLRRDFGSSKISAISMCPPGEPPLLVLNENMSADRERFTLCHELGHWVMHSEPALDTKQTEREADQFASELLMPASEIRHQLHGIDLAKAAALKRYWKTSMAALIRRAYDLEVISDTRYRSLCSQMAQRGFNRTEPMPFPREEPTVTDSMIRVHLREHGYSRKELADIVGLHEDEFTNEFAAPTSGGLRLIR